MAQTGISFITTLTALKPVGNGREQLMTRCVGYLHSKDEAIDIVKRNALDLNEAGTYPLALVETLGEGIYPETLSTHWFEWIDELGAYREIPERPEDLKRMVGFSLG